MQHLKLYLLPCDPGNPSHVHVMCSAYLLPLPSSGWIPTITLAITHRRWESAIWCTLFSFLWKTYLLAAYFLFWSAISFIVRMFHYFELFLWWSECKRSIRFQLTYDFGRQYDIQLRFIYEDLFTTSYFVMRIEFLM